jgi:hypothetical protein
MSGLLTSLRLAVPAHDTQEAGLEHDDGRAEESKRLIGRVAVVVSVVDLLGDYSQPEQSKHLVECSFAVIDPDTGSAQRLCAVRSTTSLIPPTHSRAIAVTLMAAIAPKRRRCAQRFGDTWWHARGGTRIRATGLLPGRSNRR